MRIPNRASLAAAAGAGLMTFGLATAGWSYDRPYGVPYAAPFGPPASYADPAPAPAYVGTRRPLDGTWRTSPVGSSAYGPAARPPIWTGLYIGLHGGYTTGSATLKGGLGSVGFDGAGGGLQIGFNWQTGSLVMGLEADTTWADSSGTGQVAGPAGLSITHDWLTSLRGRAGYAVDNLLVYATIGAAAGHAGLSTGSLQSSDTLVGLALGAGLELKLQDGLSLRIEGLHYMFQDRDVTLPGGTARIEADMTTIRAGLTMHFN